MLRVLLPLAIYIIWSPIISADDKNIRQKKMESFATKMETRYGFNAEEVLAILVDSRYHQDVLDILARPPEREISWLSYKNRFVDKQHIRDGKKFIAKYKDKLGKVYTQFGVPAEIVAAIIGVETNYGRLYGTYRTLDVLATIGFSDFRREEFFRYQLEEFFLLSREQGRDPLSYKSSYAGAMGYGQFLPNSYRDYAVDFDGDGIVDLVESVEDAIGSIGNYLYSFGWRKDVPVAIGATDLLKGEPKFNTRFKPVINIHTAKRRYGIEPLVDGEGGYKWRKRDKIVLLKFEQESPQIWLGTYNYYVLSRYNPSSKYIMALYLLSRSLVS